jgi:FAD:protein FMN transferase
MMWMTKKNSLALMLLTELIIITSSCSVALPPESEFVLGTVCTINLYEEGSHKLYSELFSRLRYLDRTLSANDETSEISKINKAAGKEAVLVGADTLLVVQRALEYARLTDGEFDPTVGPLVKTWNIGTEDERIPEAEELAAALTLIDWRDCVIDLSASTVFLRKPRMRLDLGAIAKGYAADVLAQMLKERGVQRALIDLGGNILTLGSRKGGKPWRIGIQDPSGQRGLHLGILQITDKTMVTSGVYERFFIEEGVRYHHLLSTKDGQPAQSGLRSVTIVAESSMDADALSTSFFLLGLERSAVLLQQFPGLTAIFVKEDNTVQTIGADVASFQLTNDAYKYIEP